MLLELPRFSTPILHQLRDASAGLNARIGLAGPAGLPALGGIRVLPYTSDEAADEDARRLSEGMARKAAVLDLPYAGGKTVVRGDPGNIKTDAFWAALGAGINTLEGRYVGGEDVNMSVSDVEALRQHTPYAVGTSQGCGNPAPFTARGVFNAMKAAIEYRFGAQGFTGIKVLIQGAGSVGHELARLVHAAGGELAVCEIQPWRAARLAQLFGAEIVSPKSLFDRRIDVFAPCALGSVIQGNNLARLDIGVICGAANNQLESPAFADLLHRMGIVYVPDYLANGGGLIAGAEEYEADREGRVFDPIRVDAKLESIAELSASYLKRSAAEARPPAAVCEDVIAERLNRPA